MEPTNTELPKPNSRREFFAKLVTMSFLTAGILRMGQSASAEDPVPPVPKDPACTTHDEDCGTPEDMSDGDCGKPDPAVPGAYNKDNDCTEPGSGVSDNDCGWPSGEGVARHEDNDCSNTSRDSDCGGKSSSGGSFAHSDSYCLPGGGGGTARDSDCGTNSVEGFGDSDCGTNLSSDGDCGVQGSEDPDNDCWEIVDNDCAQTHSDSDCARTGQDGDCWTPDPSGQDTPNPPTPPW